MAAAAIQWLSGGRFGLAMWPWVGAIGWPVGQKLQIGTGARLKVTNVRRMTGRRRLLWFGVAVVVLIGWLAIAPVKFGGTATYVVVRGTSMLPTISNGDAVMLRQASQYNIGDIVAFRSQSADAVYLHRIIDTDGSRFVLRGDNNRLDDLDRPTSGEILGRQVRLFPGAALWVERLANPVTIVFTALATAALFLAFGSRRVHRPRRHVWPSPGAASWNTVRQ